MRIAPRSSFYDGTTWSSFLRGSCVHDLALAPDGSVWVRADVDAWFNGLYVITPKLR
jgi:streptogramin lyase